ncbi:MAG TPA: hypothetical protein PKV16_08230 [Caldisericia bacterium]|nr:hypothetical protein [Caldisericia bacterium]HPF49763.1 hypothetical protein [Caldisericia bacterium]HPI84324.1 hypothetical protein [Caldisericia bacterium]HPQ93751.1 hypothetical protein [Caldisericia bacterium]HRV74825.1 hypothetical protein [Caldisericia bacterium]
MLIVRNDRERSRNTIWAFVLLFAGVLVESVNSVANLRSIPLYVAAAVLLVASLVISGFIIRYDISKKHRKKRR